MDYTESPRHWRVKFWTAVVMPNALVLYRSRRDQAVSQDVEPTGATSGRASRASSISDTDTARGMSTSDVGVPTIASPIGTDASTRSGGTSPREAVQPCAGAIQPQLRFDSQGKWRAVCSIGSPRARACNEADVRIRLFNCHR